MIPAKFRSRKFIMSLASAIVGLIVVFVPEHSDTVEGVVTQIAGLVVMLGSIMGWVMAEAVVDKEREKRQAREAETAANERISIRHQEAIQRNTGGSDSGFATLPVLAALAMVVVVAGCTATQVAGDKLTTADIETLPINDIYYRQVGTFNDVVTAAIQAKQAGLIGQETYDSTVYPAILLVDSLLDKANEARKAGREFQFRAHAREVAVALDSLLLDVRPIQQQLDDLGRMEKPHDTRRADRRPHWQPRPQAHGPLPPAGIPCDRGHDRDRKQAA